MQTAYKESELIYKKLIKEIKNRNINLVDENSSENYIYRHELKCLRERSVLPLLQADPKTNFLSITPSNLFTKDDPILRFVPTIKTSYPTSINWYEGTDIGESPFDATNTINNIFIYRLRDKSMDGFKYMLGARICSENDFPDLAERLNPNFKEISPDCIIEQLFCSICCMFDCGIHLDESQTPSVIKNDEPRSCICKPSFNSRFIQTSNISPPISCEDLNDFYKTNSNHKPFISNLSIFQSKFPFKNCVISKLMKIIFDQEIKCSTLMNQKINIKRLRPTKRTINPKEFFTPCSHSGPCDPKNCCCAERGTSCELSCRCVNCNNAVFCSCTVCDEKCPCDILLRECAELCGCLGADPHKDCGNRNIFLNKEKKVSVCKSAYHGYGLFSEGFIKKGDFVMEYKGELISDKEAERRGNFYEMNKCSYLFNAVFSRDECLYSVDAIWIGNKSRYINHSKHRANLKSNLLIQNGMTKIIFVSDRDIYHGEELLFDYHFTEEHKKRHGIID